MSIVVFKAYHRYLTLNLTSAQNENISFHYKLHIQSGNKYTLHKPSPKYNMVIQVSSFCTFVNKLLYFDITYLLTPYSRVLLEKLTGLQAVRKFPTFYGTWRFITAFISARHLSLSWARLIQSIAAHPTSWRCILILSSHLCLGLPSGLFPSGFPTWGNETTGKTQA